MPATYGRRRTALIGLLAAAALVVAGCRSSEPGQAQPQTGSSDSSVSVTPTPEYPPPPKTLVRDNVNPCKLITKAQLKEVSYRRVSDKPRPFEIKGLYKTTRCSFEDLELVEQGVALSVDPIPMRVLMDENIRAPGELTDPVGVYPASVQRANVGFPECFINVAVARDRTLVAQGTGIGGKQIAIDTLCSNARKLAAAAITTLENR